MTDMNRAREVLVDQRDRQQKRQNDARGNLERAVAGINAKLEELREVEGEYRMTVETTEVLIAAIEQAIDQIDAQAEPEDEVEFVEPEDHDAFETTPDVKAAKDQTFADGGKIVGPPTGRAPWPFQQVVAGDAFTGGEPF